MGTGKKRKREGVFICYRREDSAAFAGRLYDHLERIFPKIVFMDVEDLRVGARFAEEIGEVINRCAAFLLVIGPKWQSLLKKRDADEESDDYVRV